jgi:hypothetical protein
MRRVELIAIQPHVYGGKRLARGDYFTASYQDAKLLKAIKRAKDAPPPDYSYLENYTAGLPNEKPQDPPPVESKSLQYDTAHMEAEPDAVVVEVEPLEAEPVTTRPRRQYRRRNMTAKSSDQ